MNNDAYLSVDVEDCRRKGHHFKIAGSDKTPLKKNLICVTCSDSTRKSAYAAYGDDTKSFGPWASVIQRDRE